jgi:hypothetical protein
MENIRSIRMSKKKELSLEELDELSLDKLSLDKLSLDKLSLEELSLEELSLEELDELEELTLNELTLESYAEALALHFGVPAKGLKGLELLRNIFVTVLERYDASSVEMLRIMRKAME